MNSLVEEIIVAMFSCARLFIDDIY
jgi:hypothetical protein